MDLQNTKAITKKLNAFKCRENLSLFTVKWLYKRVASKNEPSTFFLFKWIFTRVKLHDFTANNNNFHCVYGKTSHVFCAILNFSIGNGRRSIGHFYWVCKRDEYRCCAHIIWMCMVLVIVYKWWIVWIDIVDFRFDFGSIPTEYEPNRVDLSISFRHPTQLVVHLW